MITQKITFKNVAWDNAGILHFPTDFNQNKKYPIIISMHPSRLGIGMGRDAFDLAETLLAQPILVVVGDKPGGFGAYRDGYEITRRAASEKKELLVIKGFSHYDLYDQPEPVRQALEKVVPFFKENL
ncbi:alpha/beta hydrolase [Chryseobacterium indologenes]|uniref:alpha/beta hydrolase n=1 Tax=Chryseobacterium indologenes TaxID=253 RepID=UPI00301A71B1